MTTITINLPDERVSTLKERANRLGVTPEELVQASVEELLARPAEDFQRAVDYVLKKNTNLYNGNISRPQWLRNRCIDR